MKDVCFKEGNVKFTYRVSLIIEKGDKLLFQIMPNDTNYTLVGGKVNLMEKSKDTVVREIKEEVGYDASNDDIKLVEIAEHFFDYIDKNGDVQKTHNILFIYKVILKEDSTITMGEEFAMADKESTRLCWITKEEAKDKNTSILPREAKRIIDNDDFIYEMIDDLKY